jgi:NarL family two-component system response regulator LiaR
MAVVTKKDPIKVLIVDDHEVLCDGLEAILSLHDDIKIIGKALNGKRAISICEKEPPDVILMDLMMPEMDGISTIRNILAKWPPVKIIVLTSFLDKRYVKEALKEGAVGYLHKNVTATELLNALRDTSMGKSCFSKDATEVLIEEMKTPSSCQSGLTTREKEILSLLVEGLSNKEIADKLVISTTTVKFHISNILNKLQVSSRLEAVSLAIKNNLV